MRSGPGRDRPLAAIGRALTESGLAARGAFHPAAADGVPEVAPGRAAGTLVLAGNVGPAMWRAFRRRRDPDRDLLDAWSLDVLTPIAERFDGIALFPFQRPYLPFQRWSTKAEACHISPLGIALHADYGLWHGYRGALALSKRLELPAPNRSANACEGCAGRPCLFACPVAAFKVGRYDVAACVAHLSTAAGADCMALGCRARRACPVGRAYRYAPEQAAFHMRHFLRHHGGQRVGRGSVTADGRPMRRVG